MYRTIVSLLLCAVTFSLYGQNHADSTDIFFGHTDLGEATVTGVTGRVRQGKSPASVQVVSQRELHHVSATNVVSAVSQLTPGVSQLTTGSGISKPLIRGLGFNRIVCLADGVRQEGQQWGDEHGLELDGAGVESVEIIKGPASLMYGSDAMAGVLIFNPFKPLPEGTMRGNASGEYQTNSGLWHYDVGHRGNARGIVWDILWSQQAAHAYKNSRDGYVAGTQHRSHAARTILGLDKSWGHSLLTLSLYHLSPSIAESEEEEGGEDENQAPVHKIKTYGRTLPFQRVDHYKAVLDNAFRIGQGTLTAILGYQQNRRREYEESAAAFGLGLDLHVATFDVRYVTPIGKGWKVAAGTAGMWQHSLNKGDEYLVPDYSLMDWGLFATASREIGAFSLSGGLRFDTRHVRAKELEDEGALRFQQIARNFNGLTGSLGAVWHAARGLNIKMNVAHGFRAPNIPELASNGIHEGAFRYELGNANLKAEHSWQVDMGANYINQLLSAELCLFANRIDNYVYTRRTLDVIDEHPVYRYTSGDARLAGFEAALDIHPIHALHFKNTFAYVHAVLAHQPQETKYLPLTPAPHWRSELKWEITASGKTSASLFPANAFISLVVDCYFRQDHCYRLDGTETATPSYTLVGINAGTDLVLHGRKAAEVFVCVDNLFDRAYQSHLSRLKYAGDKGFCNPGRNVTFRVTFPF